MTPHPKDTSSPDHAELIGGHIHLIKEVMNRVAMRFPRHVDREDLWSAGAIGLIEAAGRFEPSRGSAFASYAKVRIAGAMIDATRSRDWAPRSLRRNARAIEASTDVLRQSAGREPTDDELATCLGTTAMGLAKMRADVEASIVISLHRPNRHGLWTGDDAIDIAVEHHPEQEALRRETIETLRDAVEHLPPAHMNVVRRYYLEGDRLRDIAADSGVSEARVSQLRAEAVSALRRHFQQLDANVPDVDE